MDDIFKECDCKTLLTYDLPCCHNLYDLKSIEMVIIPTRWWLEKPDEICYNENSNVNKEDTFINVKENTEGINLIKEPWMKCISKIKRVFRSFNNDYKKTVHLMGALDKDLDSIVNEKSVSIEETSLGLPKVYNVKSSGRPKKIISQSASKKVFGKDASYRKNSRVYGKNIALKLFKIKQEEKEKNADEEIVEEVENSTERNHPNEMAIEDTLKEIDETFDTFDFDVNEVLELVPKPDSTTGKIVNVNSKRKLTQKSIDDGEPIGKKKRENDNSIQKHSSKPHPFIDIKNVSEIYDPVGDGNCGYRSIAFLHYGDEERYKDVKRQMLKTFEHNKIIYEKHFGFNLISIEKNITSGLDDNINPIWSITPYCAQVTADTYNIPVCVYSDATSSDTSPLTVLPIRMPTKPKLKIQPYCLQNYSNIHWFGIKFRHLQMKYPVVHHLYFKLNDFYVNLFKTSWNLFGQLPKHKESKPFDPKMDELLLIQSSDEE